MARSPGSRASLGGSEGSREVEVRRVLNEIVDPCSVASGTQLGIVDMGIVEAVDIRGNAVTVTLLPTFPGCLFLPVFATEVEERLRVVEWVEAVVVALAPPTVTWDESRLSASGFARLTSAREHRRAQLRRGGDKSG
jgi:metal-sulfur cluster biosynthetic enzyme